MAARSPPARRRAHHRVGRQFSKRDADRLPAYYKMLDSSVDLLRSAIAGNATRRSAPHARSVGHAADGPPFRKLDARVQRDIHELFTRSAGDLLDHWFESDGVKALYGFDAVVGSFASPYTPGSAYVLLHHVFGEVNGKAGVWGHAVGGMGAITQAMAAEARRLGVISKPTHRSNASSPNRCATGIELEDGRVIQGNAVAANVGPKLLYLKLLAEADLPAEFRGRIERLRVGSATFRMNVALSELPKFTAAPRDDGGAHLGLRNHSCAVARIHGSRLRRCAARRNVAQAHRGDADSLYARQQHLAPKGAHVASLFCQHFSYKLPGGRDWRQEKQRAIDLIF